jgi:hypothetical protein
MTNNRLPFIGSGRPQEGGALATRKQDFNSHIDGTGFRQTADTIDMNPSIFSNNTKTVQDTFESLQNSITSSGTGFISIGNVDGYAQGGYNVGSNSTPTLYEAFNAAFADIRLQGGGVILLLAGTYHLRQSVTVPPGISIMGEIGGTIIIGEMQETPMFIVSKTIIDIQLVTGISFNIGSNIGAVKFFNLTLIDNLDGYVLFGEPTMTTVPMIQAEISSNLICEQVTFVGKIHSGVTPRTKTKAAISYTGSGTTGTSLVVKNCYIDGFKIGISFTPANNNLDFLTVSGCKGRVYGSEDSNATGASVNSFIVMTHCNASIINNYYSGAGTYANYLVNIISGIGTNVKVIISGNTGIPFTLSSGELVIDSSASTFTSIINGNNWGTSVDNPWYITVGGSAGTSPIGDFYGPRAIDTILSIANVISNFRATVIVNPGTYTINGINTASYNFASLKFIGNKNGKNYPIFNLDLTLSNIDSLNNRPLALGNYLESIHFNSLNHRHSIRPGYNPTSVAQQTSAHTLEVVDCIFTNTSLYALDLGTGPAGWLDTLSNLTTTNISIKNCSFLQNGTFIDTVSMLLPQADEVHVENCFFTGNGYALSIGDNGYTSAHSSSFGNIKISNSIFDLTNYTITSHNSSLSQSYVLIDNVVNLNIDNCQIYSSNQYNGVAPVSTTLTSVGTFNKFVHLKSINININDSIFVGPYQTYTSGGVNYAMPGLFIDTLQSTKISNCRLIGSALPLQFGGSTLSDADFRDSIIVENCHIRSSSQTLVDFDLGLVNEDFIAYVIIKGCNFSNSIGTLRVQHSNVNSGTKNGIVQLFVGDCYVSFTDNVIYGNISSITSMSNYGALVIDNTSPSLDQVNPAIIEGNTFYITNSYTSATTSAGAACIYLRSSSIRIENNLLSMYNNSAISGSFTGCLIIDNPESASGSYSDSHITGNIFARRDYLGNFGNLARGYIQILATSSSANGGMIVNNSFDFTTYNGTSTILVEDNSEVASSSINLSHWVISQNKNQIGSPIITWGVGSKGIATGADLAKVVLYGGAVSPSKIYADSVTNDRVIFSYANTGSQDQFTWTIPFTEILPPDVTITHIAFTFQASAVPATTKTVVATIVGADGNDTTSTTITGTGSVTPTITPSLNYTSKSTDAAYLIIQANINHSLSMTVTIRQVIITYHW